MRDFTTQTSGAGTPRFSEPGAGDPLSGTLPQYRAGGLCRSVSQHWRPVAGAAVATKHPRRRDARHGGAADQPDASRRAGGIAGTGWHDRRRTRPDSQQPAGAALLGDCVNHGAGGGARLLRLCAVLHVGKSGAERRLRLSQRPLRQDSAPLLQLSRPQPHRPVDDPGNRRRGEGAHFHRAGAAAGGAGNRAADRCADPAVAGPTCN
jgi:hypothetical protein